MNETAIALIRALPDGAIIVNGNGHVVAANAAAADIFQSQLNGLSLTSVIRSPAFSSSFSSVVNTKIATMVDVEFHGRPPRQVNAHIAPFGQEGGILIVMRDLTREQAIEKMRSDFVANASHEMRTPLATIIGSVETLQGAAKNDAKARDMFLSTMLSQAHRMKRLIDDLLTLSRIELNEHVRPNGKVALLNILKQAKANLAQQASDLKVSFIISGDAELNVAGDADELMQVAQNLIENAIKYGGDGGKVELSCFTRGSEACFAVKDYGKGIAEVHLPRLTERFYRVSTQESRARGGTGLGLAIVKHILLRHRGKLDISSKPGEGSTFTVSLPRFDS
jgi:two-component system, OmpR family, phosphate regulon sensor histidine kinase PhoR